MMPKGKVKRVIYGGPDGIVVSKATKNPEVAWTLTKFLIGPEAPISWYLKGLGMVPFNRKLALSQEWLGNSPPEHLSVLLESAEYMYADFNPGYNEWQTAQRNQLDAAFLGQKSTLDACRAAATAINEILARFK
jgi:ABC-type glycerol-3-phosphate transport system substrate-binding protein